MWCASVAGWVLSNVLNDMKECIMKVIEKVRNYVNVEITAIVVVVAGALLYGDARSQLPRPIDA